MNKEVNDFQILTFSEYKDVKNQYTDAFIKNSCCVKIFEDRTTVRIAVADGFEDKIDVLKDIHYPKTIEIISVEQSEFAEFIGNHVEKKVKVSESEKNDTLSLTEINSEAPIVNIVNGILLEAIRKKVSDIHIQCNRDVVLVRFRIDGVLQVVKKLDKKIYPLIVSRIKIMANLNVMENRLCQDGRLSVTIEEKKIDFRISIVPTTTGQSIVLRLFNKENSNLSLENLGFSDEVYKELDKAIFYPYGMILATGPTGSGKTTTLHALMERMDKEHLKIVSIEDPVEEEIEGIEQIQVNNEIGLSFNNILRRILRQDPDVIMVGEIRDEETAELAVRAALTGHLILSTLHTNDSISCITRFKNLGIEPYLISSVLRLCLAQRLVRKVCTNCNGAGCEVCNGIGYKGRTAISEIFINSSEISNLIESKKSEKEIRNYLINSGFKTLVDDAGLKLKNGVTTKDELIREGLL